MNVNSAIQRQKLWQDWEKLVKNQGLNYKDYHSSLSAFHRLLIHYGAMHIQNGRPIDEFKVEMHELVNQASEWLAVQEKKRQDSLGN